MIKSARNELNAGLGDLSKGHWMKLPADKKGKGPNGEPSAGKTWVKPPSEMSRWKAVGKAGLLAGAISLPAAAGTYGTFALLDRLARRSARRKGMTDLRHQVDRAARNLRSAAPKRTSPSLNDAQIRRRMLAEKRETQAPHRSNAGWDRFKDMWDDSTKTAMWSGFFEEAQRIRVALG